MSTPADVTPFDPRPLVEAVDPTAARQFAQQLRASGRLPGVFGANGLAIALFAVFGVIFLFMFATVGVSVVGAFVSMGMQSGSPWLVLPALVPVLVIVGILVVTVVAFIRNAGGASDRWYRLDRFARANSMSYIPLLANPPLPGMIFSLGGSRQASDLVRGEHPRFVEFANYRYDTGSGKDRTTHHWGYVAVKLDVPLPNIVLDALSNNGLFGASNLPASFDKQQRLSLEGDFDQHFSLYCPEGYERDALYLFTPDIMVRFIDHAAALDIEIVDDWLFLYARREFSTLDPATWAWLFSIVGALLDKFAQWARWRDDRLAAEAVAAADATAPPVHAAVTADPHSGQPAVVVPSPPFAAPAALLRPPPGVAPGGRRLRRKVPWVAFVVMGAFVLFWLLMQAGMFGGFLGFLN